MRCLLCENFSLTHICKTCQKNFLQPSIYKRKIINDIEVISFYKYSDIKSLLHTKHTELGYYIYSIMAKNSFLKFTQNFEYPNMIHSIAIDDNPKDNYSHTAILNNHLKGNNIIPLNNILRAKNAISYSGKSKGFRVAHPREFHLNKLVCKEIILVDDIITTGTTLNEAITLLNQHNVEVKFCLTLADSSK